MNKKFLFLGLAAVALTVQSCRDDQDFDSGARVPEGTEIQFGAGLIDPKTRTYYGSDDVKLDSWPIYWNYQPGTQDEIFIYSPDCPAGRNQAVYRVDCTTAEKAAESQVTRVSDNVGIQTGTAETYNFYALYPAKFVTGTATGNVISAYLPGDQSVTFAGTKQDPSMTTVPEAASGSGRDFVMKPNMDYCIMTGVNKDVTVTADQKVTVPFSPFSSMIDITINGPETNTTTEATTARITSVIIEANAPISGDFSVDFSSGSPEFKAGSNASNIINIPVRGNDAEGDPVGIPLMNGNTLNLKAFILPNPAVTDIKVRLVTATSQTWTKTLNVSGYLQPHQIHPVKLPTITLDEGQFDYSVWLSQLDPRIYISEISLPGSALCYNQNQYVSDVAIITQGSDVAAQFNAGARVFQAHCWLVEETSTIDDNPTSFHLTTSKGVDTGVPLVPLLEILQVEMEQNHGNEFCVLMLSDYKIENSSYSFVDFYDRFKVVSEELAKRGILTEKDITPNTTIADVKGKIILKLALNGSTNNSGNRADQLNTALYKLQAQGGLSGAQCMFNMFTEHAESALFYSPLSYGQVGTFGFTPAVSAGGRITTYMSKIAEITNSTTGMNTSAAERIIKTSGVGSLIPFSAGTCGNANGLYSSAPADMSSDMWYIYSEQANAGDHYSTAIGNINKVVGAINSTYNKDTHNKFYMTYCGGIGGKESSTSYSVQAVTTGFNARWKEQIASVENKPYGWVMFNDVTGSGTQECIKMVIGNNNKEGFKLNRDRSQKVDQNRPSGDVQGATNGGSLF